MSIEWVRHLPEAGRPMVEKLNALRSKSDSVSALEKLLEMHARELRELENDLISNVRNNWSAEEIESAQQIFKSIQ